jgi:hypothetical protein
MRGRKKVSFRSEVSGEDAVGFEKGLRMRRRRETLQCGAPVAALADASSPHGCSSIGLISKLAAQKNL